MFNRNFSKSGNAECIFRVVQDGILNLVPYMTKRIVRSKSVDLLKTLISQRHNDLPTLPAEKETLESIDALTPGCFVLVIELPEGNIEALAMHKFKEALSTMVGKENLFSLHVRYLDQDEREKAKEHLNAIKK